MYASSLLVYLKIVQDMSFLFYIKQIYNEYYVNLFLNYVKYDIESAMFPLYQIFNVLTTLKIPINCIYIIYSVKNMSYYIIQAYNTYTILYQNLTKYKHVFFAELYRHCFLYKDKLGFYNLSDNNNKLIFIFDKLC